MNPEIELMRKRIYEELEPENARLREQAEALEADLRLCAAENMSYERTIGELNDRLREQAAREAFALAGTEPYVSQETRRDTEVYE